jgi:cation diffusion facilitator family transporter
MQAIQHPKTELLKRQAASVSLAYNIVLTLLKVAAAVVTGSVSLLSEAVHSATDVVASLIAFLSVRAAAAPPDEDHPYGHGKIESLAGFGESILLLLIVLYVVFEAVQRLLNGSEVQALDVGIWVMGFSTLSSFAVGRFVSRVGRETGSMALCSNGQHLMIDFWTSLGVLVALTTTKLTGWREADSVFAIGLGAWLAFGAWRLIHEAYHQLIDRRITDEELARIHSVLRADPDLISYHRLRTRHSGNLHYVDVHVVVPREWSVVQAHDLADHLEKQIAEAVPPAQVVIHVDPFDPAKARS